MFFGTKRSFVSNEHKITYEDNRSQGKLILDLPAYTKESRDAKHKALHKVKMVMLALIAAEDYSLPVGEQILRKSLAAVGRLYVSCLPASAYCPTQ